MITVDANTSSSLLRSSPPEPGAPLRKRATLICNNQCPFALLTLKKVFLMAAFSSLRLCGKLLREEIRNTSDPLLQQLHPREISSPRAVHTLYSSRDEPAGLAQPRVTPPFPLVSRLLLARLHRAVPELQSQKKADMQVTQLGYKT